jgi:8-oxo-dGTP pyrophosphatase MutT (NUDIX family)
VRVELLSHDGCPLVGHTRTLLRECLAEVGLTASVIEKVGAYPSPTVLVDGRDVMGDPGVAPGMRHVGWTPRPAPGCSRHYTSARR